MAGIKNTFIEELNSFYQKLQQIVGEFNMNINISENEDRYNSFLSDIQQIFEPSNLVVDILKGRIQLGLLPRIKEEWKDATHTRYEHSIGVTTKCIVVFAYLNSKIKDNIPKLTEQDIRELALAAALHDVGHLPVSHAVERAFLCSEYKKEEVTHESRIIPMFLGENHPLFKDLFEKISKWNNFENDSQLRVAYLISDDETKKYIKSPEFKYPKRVIQQLLSSEIDMDRLDFILRDAQALKYTPVTLIEDKILYYIKGLSLRSTYQTSKNIENNTELCIDSNYIENIFIFLVCRLLMYKDCYFSPEVRAFEGLLTYIVSEFLLYGPKLNSEELIEYTDEMFCKGYLEKRIEFLPANGSSIDRDNGITSQEHIRKQIQAINENKTNRYKLLYSIDLKNPSKEDSRKLIPRLKDELEIKINNHTYINDIKNRLIKESSKSLKERMFKRGEFLIDVFSIKEGEGNLLVSEIDQQKKEEVKLLKDYMNGSNIHRLYTKKRLDFYHKSDLSPERVKILKEQIINFFYEQL